MLPLLSPDYAVSKQVMAMLRHRERDIRRCGNAAVNHKGSTQLRFEIEPDSNRLSNARIEYPNQAAVDRCLMTILSGELASPNDSERKFGTVRISMEVLSGVVRECEVSLSVLTERDMEQAKKAMKERLEAVPPKEKRP